MVAVAQDRMADLLDLEAIRTEKAERYLREFVKQAWHVVEPATPYQHNWHIDALCDHLQSTLPPAPGGTDRIPSRAIRNLLITMPPRAMKSLTVSVFFPAWAWIHLPEMRFLYASYAQSLSTEHSQLTRMVIESEWYQQRWGDRFQLADDDNLKTRFSNTKRGYRIATSVGASVTGFGGDFVICLPEDEMVWTEIGPKAIGDIVRERLQVRVWSRNLTTGAMELKPIEGWHTNPGSEIVEVGLSDGARLRCTPDHRIWTCNRGWVEAQRLLPSDVLPCAPIPDALNHRLVDAESPAESTAGLARIQDRADVIGGQFASVPAAVRGEADSLGDIRPDDAVPNVLNGGSADTVVGCEVRCLVSADGNLSNLILGEDGTRSPLVDREGAMFFGIRDVLSARAVGEVRQHAVSSVAIEMPDLMPVGARPNECSHQDLMDKELEGSPILPGVESRVSLMWGSLEDSVGDGKGLPVAHRNAAVTPDPSEARYAVQALEAGDRSPLFVRHHSIVASTYCITVADHHNFVAGDKIIIANCDDPHNVQQAESASVRQTAVDWWNRAMSTRLNNPNTGVRIVVMQRVHENDVAGSVLEKGGYTHLNLPMEYEGATDPTPIGWRDPRSEDGELLWPERYGPEKIADFKSDLGSYAYAAQFQQRPAPLEGGILKRPWFGTYINRPLDAVVVQFWDTAYKTGTDNDYTVCATLAYTRTHRYVLDVYRERLEYPDLKRMIPRLYAQWRPEAVLIEDKALGQSALQDMRRETDIPVIAIPVVKDKIARVNEMSPIIEAGRLSLPEAATWLEDAVHELTTFPLAAHDDIVDAIIGGLAWIESRTTKQTSWSGSWLPDDEDDDHRSEWA